MIDIPTKYESSFFCSMGNLKPSPETIPVLLDLFRQEGLLPTVLHEVRPGSTAPRPILQMGAPEGEWVITLRSDRILFQKSPTVKVGRSTDDSEAFAADVTCFAARILERFPRQGVRLAFVTAGLMEEMSEETLRHAYERLFHSTEFYTKHCPVEWAWRSVARVPVQIGVLHESLNLITSINRVPRELSSASGTTLLDRIEVQFDINTHQESIETRFDSAGFASFLKEALRLRAELLSEVEGLING